MRRLAMVAGLMLVATAATAASTEAVRIDPDGVVHAPPMAVPPSNFLSPQAKHYLAEHLQDLQKLQMLVQHDGVPPLLAGYLKRQETLFPVTVEDARIGGVHARVFTPPGGVAAANRRRVLIDLHGGGFSSCFPGCAELESRPLAALGGFKVVSVDYREAPDFRFPAASEDVAAVYRELLKTYPPANIGIYGCSAGGMLTGMAVAWFQAHGLPRSGAIGVFCAGLAPVSQEFGGDSTYTAFPLGESRPAPAYPPPPGAGAAPLAYLAGTNPRDPLVAPVASPDVLRRFPPTLIITATRGFELSSAVYTHSQMVKLGVNADLHVWEGLFHGFFYNPDIPESREAYNVMVQFFDQRLER